MNFLIGEQAVFGGELYAVVPLHSLAEIKGDGFPAVCDGPPFGQVADKLDVLVVLHQAVEDLVVDRARRGVVRNDRVQPPRVADGALDKRIRVPLDLLAAGREKKNKDKDVQGKFIHLKEFA